MFPGTLLIHAIWPHAAGLHTRPEDGAHLFVSRGAGFWGPPIRVGSPPEIGKLVLLAS